MMLDVDYPGEDRDEVPVAGWLRFRFPDTLIDWLVITLGVVAVVAGFIALFGSFYASGASSTVGREDHGHEFQSWELAALLTVFAGLVGLSLAEARRVRQVSSLLVLAIALTGAVAWWWSAIDELVGRTYVDTGHVALGGSIVFTGIALGLQIIVGVLMFMAAFPFSDEASVRGAT